MFWDEPSEQCNLKSDPNIKRSQSNVVCGVYIQNDIAKKRKKKTEHLFYYYCNCQLTAIQSSKRQY